MSAVRIFASAVSAAGVESLIQHPEGLTDVEVARETRREARITDGPARISVGIESTGEPVFGLQQALDKSETDLQAV